jgi:hypothetical protein
LRHATLGFDVLVVGIYVKHDNGHGNKVATIQGFKDALLTLKIVTRENIKDADNYLRFAGDSMRSYIRENGL